MMSFVGSAATAIATALKPHRAAIPAISFMGKDPQGRRNRWVELMREASTLR
jgi:hypothetical protein